MPSADRPLCLALFDCDGTLVDSQAAIIGAMTSAWNAVGLPDPDPNAVRRIVGLTIVQAIAVLLPEADTDQHERIAELYKQAFHDQRSRGEHLEPLYEGAVDALDAIEEAGFLLGVATGKSRRGLHAVLDLHGLRDRFVTLQTSDEGPGKPHPAMIHRALQETGAEPANTVMIGDTTFDMLMAASARVKGLGVAWGYHDPAKLREAGAALVVNRYPAVPDAVHGLLSLDCQPSPIA